MENRKEEFLKIVCQSYLIVILAVLPLYYIPWNGYYKLGDTKYYLYRNVSLLCQGIALLAMCVFAVSSRWTGEHRIFARSLAEVVKKSVDKCRTHAVTTAVCLYGICALLSAICSPYGSIAWNGEREWYMGAVTICLMIGGFLLTAKYGGSCKTAIWLGEAAFVAVTLIGLLQKLGYDPLGLLKGYVVGDWEFTHMLTTLGNSNWLSGYYSVMFPFSMTLFHRAVEAGKKGTTLLAGTCNMLAMMLLLLQGSDSGVIVACTVMGLCFWLDRKQTGHWEAYFLFLAAVALGMYRWSKWMLYLGTFDILLQDGIAKKLAAWQGWIPVAAGCLLLWGVCRRIPENKKKILQEGVLCCALAGIAVVLAWYLHRLSVIDFAEWGNRRGRLWQMAWMGFRRGNLHQKLLGAGPDCFASYLGELLPGGTVLFDKGYFEGSVFTNAHNEWLTTLVNMGLLGVAAYAAVFITALQTYRKNFLAVLLLLTYGIHSLISFQQVLNAPLFFLILGLCEAAARGEKTKTNQMDTDEELLEAI